MTASQAVAPATPAPFDFIAETYDDVFTDSLIGRAQRSAVWRELDRTFGPGQRIVELNCGTGVDALHLAQRGVQVVAFDVAPRMIEIAQKRLSAESSRAPVDFRVLAIEDLATLEKEGPFDGAFSNFAGLNCVQNLAGVARGLAHLLRPGSTALLCMAGCCVAWEVGWYLAHGKARKALRRFHRGPIVARLTEGVTVSVHYPSVRQMARALAPEFKLRSWKGIGVTVPPSYLEPLARRFPAVLEQLVAIDRWLGRLPGARSIADHVLLEFERVRT